MGCVVCFCVSFGNGLCVCVCVCVPYFLTCEERDSITNYCAEADASACADASVDTCAENDQSTG